MTINWWKIHSSKSHSIASLPLALFSFLNGLGVALRLRQYARGRKRSSLPGFVLSIGNLTAGGTGKTPAACLLAEWALSEGYRVAILSRGYGAHTKAKVLEVSDGHTVFVTSSEAGDEPYLLAKKLPGVPVVISKRRYLAGLVAHKRFKTNFYILDDGFQHLALKRDLNLVLLDSEDPFGNGHLLPLGPLREPVDNLERADLFILTRCREGASENPLEVFLTGRFPGKPHFKSDHLPHQVHFPYHKRSLKPDFLHGKRVAAFAGIARPDTFKNTLIGLGVNLVFFQSFQDHHRFQVNEIRDLIRKKGGVKADLLITTEKDWVRLENLAPTHPDLAYLSVRLSLLSDRERFFGMIKEKASEILRRK